MTGGEVPHSGNPGDALPASVQVAAVLLIVQALIKSRLPAVDPFHIKFDKRFIGAVPQSVLCHSSHWCGRPLLSLPAWSRASWYFNAHRRRGRSVWCSAPLASRTSFTPLAASFTSFLRDLRFTFLGFPGSSPRHSSPSILRGSSSSYCGAKSRPIGEHWSGPR